MENNVKVTNIHVENFDYHVWIERVGSGEVGIHIEDGEVIQ